MPKRQTRKPDRVERRENALRPSHYLGYDRDGLGVYLVNRHAHDLAEPQFRRAIWLNPFEPQFKEHLAFCLYKQGRYAEAKEWILKSLEQKEDPNARDVLRKIEERLEDE